MSGALWTDDPASDEISKKRAAQQVKIKSNITLNLVSSSAFLAMLNRARPHML